MDAPRGRRGTIPRVRRPTAARFRPPPGSPRGPHRHGAGHPGRLRRHPARGSRVPDVGLGRKSASVVGLEKCVKLEELSANNCGITSLEGFPSLQSLTKLELSDNRISGGLAALKNLPSLVELSVAGNAIGSVDELQALKDAPLVVLDLVGCPCSDDSQEYRDKVFGMFPSLQVLDGKDKDGEEVELGSDDDDGEEDFDEEESGRTTKAKMTKTTQTTKTTKTRTYRMTNRSKSPTRTRTYRMRTKRRATTTTMSLGSRLWSARPSTTTRRRRIKPSPILSRRISTTKRMTTTPTRARRRNRGRSETPNERFGRGNRGGARSGGAADVAPPTTIQTRFRTRLSEKEISSRAARVFYPSIENVSPPASHDPRSDDHSHQTFRVGSPRHSPTRSARTCSWSADHHGGAVRAGTRRAPDARAQDDARLRAVRRAVRRGDRAIRVLLRARSWVEGVVGSSSNASATAHCARATISGASRPSPRTDTWGLEPGVSAEHPLAGRTYATGKGAGGLDAAVDAAADADAAADGLADRRAPAARRGRARPGLDAGLRGRTRVPLDGREDRRDGDAPCRCRSSTCLCA